MDSRGRKVRAAGSWVAAGRQLGGWVVRWGCRGAGVERWECGVLGDTAPTQVVDPGSGSVRAGG